MTEQLSTNLFNVAPRSWLRRRRWFLLSIFFVVMLVLCHSLLLRYLALILIAEEIPADHAVVVLYDSGVPVNLVVDVTKLLKPPKILQIRQEPERLELDAIEPGRNALERLALLDAGVAEGMIFQLAGVSRTDYERMRILGSWLREHPEEKATLLVSRFNSARIRRIAEEILGRDSVRIRILAIADPRFNEDNWFRVKEGQQEFINGMIHYGYVRLHGEGETRSPSWNPDAFEQGLPGR